MRKVNIHEAKTTLSRLVEAAEAGERIILARAGRPVAQIVRLDQSGGIRLGTMKGRIPAELLETIDQSISRADIERIFGGDLEP
jgi:prevent-host-death family protein